MSSSPLKYQEKKLNAKPPDPGDAKNAKAISILPFFLLCVPAALRLRVQFLAHFPQSDGVSRGRGMIVKQGISHNL
jgi:hypothetical protein